MLRALEVRETRNIYRMLNGRYPVLFNFPMLQRLKLSYCLFLKWDLDMLSGSPLLRELKLYTQPGLTGDLKSLRVMKNTLEKVDIQYCHKIHGNFMELADFPRLKKASYMGRNNFRKDTTYV
eukprot:scaffold29298_cov152-Skeletonema_dohrnii-CCMP3373.AAC.10